MSWNPEDFIAEEREIVVASFRERDGMVRDPAALETIAGFDRLLDLVRWNNAAEGEPPCPGDYLALMIVDGKAVYTVIDYCGDGIWHGCTGEYLKPIAWTDIPPATDWMLEAIGAT